MPGGGFGGDGSVQWYVEVDAARDGETKVNPRPGHPKGMRHEGIDETLAGGFFRVVIKLPRDANQRSEFLASLSAVVAAAAAAPPTITIILPIEDNNNGGGTADQVKVTWP